MPLLKDNGMIGGPGKQYYYSTHGYTILGTVMEAVSGKDFPRLLYDELRDGGADMPRCIGGGVGGKTILISKLWDNRKPKRKNARRIHGKYKLVSE